MWAKTKWSDLLVSGLSRVGSWRTGGAVELASTDAPRSSNSVALDDDDVNTDSVRTLLSQDRYAILLRPQIAATLTARQIAAAKGRFEEQTTLVPSGDVRMRRWRSGEEDAATDEIELASDDPIVRVGAFYLDRFPVTNRQFAEFVDAGGYSDTGLWDVGLLPSVQEFVDRTGRLGPRFWRDGLFKKGTESHPVVGICWFEAAAYARWVGKRLPTDAEWVKAASCPMQQPNGPPTQRRYPWGDAMDRQRANLWGSGPGETVPVDAYPEGATVGGARQMVGNVWEWMADEFLEGDEAESRIDTDMALKSIRGGAFDTFCDTQANCFFASGEGLFSRKHNIGFRLAIGACDVV